eukprot:TRINITY_DN2567_c0_g2_i9.p1 TRINITY_DN2567_c0_g2~~TRINITY_DN2567_c0_g2_i9.p1  ORF type:complete len:198 (-),score=54.44 TRINITY_DN2567_c0_g2_i9:15-608(-)
MEEVAPLSSKLNCNYDEFFKKAKSELESMKALEVFLAEYARLNRSYAESLFLILSKLPPLPNPITGLQTAVHQLVSELKVFAHNCASASQRILSEEVSSLAFFCSELSSQTAEARKAYEELASYAVEAKQSAKHAYEIYNNDRNALKDANAKFDFFLRANIGFSNELDEELIIDLSLIHICRCRRYAVCRSRWSPYH